MVAIMWLMKITISFQITIDIMAGAAFTPFMSEEDFSTQLGFEGNLFMITQEL